jgi:uncharacterized membrane protein
MKVSRPTLLRIWTNWTAPIAIAGFSILAIFLAFLQHAAFRTNLYDLGSYTHLVWNIAQGRLFVTSLWPANYLTNHFSLLLVVLAPLFYLWPDPRTLMVVQQIILACSIIPAYVILRHSYPRLAPALVLAFVFSPLLHQTSTAEFHGIMLAVPFLSWAFYALYNRRTWSLIIPLALALLAREDVGIYVASFGLFLLLFRKGQRLLGAGLIALGGLWLIAIINWVMPALGRAYNHFKVFSTLGSSMPEIAGNALKDPGRIIGIMLTTSKIKALIGLLAPFAGLPLLALDYAILWLPITGIYLISNASGTGLLNSWRVAPLLPLLWGGTAVLMTRLRPRRAAGALGVLGAATAIGFLILSPFPGGGKFDESLYTIDEHTRIGEEIVASIPADAYVAAQNGLAAHLATRQQIRIFPRFDRARQPDLIVLDTKAVNQYPLAPDEYAGALSDLKTNPELAILHEQDGYLVFQHLTDAPAPAHPMSTTWSSLLRLDGFELAQAQPDGAFEPITATLHQGSPLRVALYWTALEPMSEYYAISVRLLDAAGNVVAQDDSWPAQGAVPTPLWEAGRSLRDLHYLDLSNDPASPPVALEVIVYAADTLKPLTSNKGNTLITFPVSTPAPH